MAKDICRQRQNAFPKQFYLHAICWTASSFRISQKRHHSHDSRLISSLLNELLSAQDDISVRLLVESAYKLSGLIRDDILPQYQYPSPHALARYTDIS